MREYELTYIVQPEISDEGLAAIQGRLDGLLEKRGAKKLFIDDMGRRRLAYEIGHFQKGQYLTLFFLAEGGAVADLERALKLDDSVLRYLTVLANPNVRDVEARLVEAAEIERIRIEKAAERAAREAEEAARAEAEAVEAGARAEAEAAEASARAEAADAGADDDETNAGEAEAAAGDADDEEKA